MGWLQYKLSQQKPKTIRVKYIAVMDEYGDIIKVHEVGLRVLYPGDTLDIHYRLKNELGPEPGPWSESADG